jgi:hypothetical protein
MALRSTLRHRVRVASALLAGALTAGGLIAGCGAVSMTPPAATPTDFPGLAGRLNAAGIRVADWVSGDPGCDDPDLRATAIRFTARGRDQADPVTLYLYVFRNRAAFERNRAKIGPCAGAYVTDPQSFEQVEQSPYVLAGQGPWAPGFEAALRATLEIASGSGG